jgi:hypothetical protein
LACERRARRASGNTWRNRAVRKEKSPLEGGLKSMVEDMEET